MTDKKFTDEEIIKRLEDYIKENEFEYFHSNTVGEYPLIRKSLDLINRQKAENEMLKKRISDKKHALFEQQEYMAELQRTLETKCDDCDNIRLSRTEYWKAIKAAKAEAHKEFAERIRECCDLNNDLSTDAWLSVTADIDCVLKEMVGEKE